MSRMALDSDRCSLPLAPPVDAATASTVDPGHRCPADAHFNPNNQTHQRSFTAPCAVLRLCPIGRPTGVLLLLWFSFAARSPGVPGPTPCPHYACRPSTAPPAARAPRHATGSVAPTVTQALPGSRPAPPRRLRRTATSTSSWTISTISEGHRGSLPPPHTPCTVLYLVTMTIGC